MKKLTILTLSKKTEDLLMNAPEFGMGYHFTESGYIVINCKEAIHISDLERYNGIILNKNHITKEKDTNQEINLSTLKLNKYEPTNSDGSKPEFEHKTKEGEKFYRFSIYKEDTKMRGGNVAAKTYATSKNDIKVIRSGLAAVGRYALPKTDPAIHVFEITPPAGTIIFQGTVKPNYGQSGGGVEVYFPKELKGCSKYWKKIPIR